MYLLFCFISPPVDSYLESMAEGKSVFTSTDSPYCAIDQSTDTTAQKTFSPKEEKYAMKRRWDGTFQLSERPKIDF